MIDIEAITRPNGIVPVDIETTAELVREVCYLREKLRGITDYVESIGKAHPDLVLSIHGLRPITEMLPIWRSGRLS